MPEDNIEHNPQFKYKPPIGGRLDGQVRGKNLYDHINTTYANLDVIDSRLKAIQSYASRLDSFVKSVLSKHSLVITDSDSDADLRAAQEAEWPITSTTPKEYITYNYYLYLGLRNTSSASYIRKRYREALRDVTGSNALDLVEIVDMIRDEAALAQTFVANTIGSMDDTAEFRATELIQDWAGSALDKLQEIEEIIQGRGQVNSLPQNEVDTLATEEAGKAQAVFKVKLNSANKEIEQHIEIMKRDWSQYADVFFNRYLSPAVNFRLNVTRNVYPMNTTIGQELYKASGSLDTNLSVALTDFARRNRIFETKSKQLMSLIIMRDTYRNYITQLSTVGTSIATGSAGTTIEETDSLSEAEFFTSALSAVTEDTSNVFTSQHDLLEGRDSDVAHMQYLLRSGDNITGNITVDDNITIDGVDIDRHRHTGGDGSPKINAASIEAGSLTPDLFDTSTQPDTPTGLYVQSVSTRLVPPGVTIMDVVLAWQGSDDTTIQYEVNIAPVN